tara:strand:- start:1192 stop:1431 length:240 start_codon:yes stop_codon:yes gene_type:complete
MMITISKGTIFQRSITGYYNFYYPDKDSAILEKTVMAEKLNWINFDGMQAIKVRRADLEDNVTFDDYVAIWVDLKDLGK